MRQKTFMPNKTTGGANDATARTASWVNRLHTLLLSTHCALKRLKWGKLRLSGSIDVVVASEIGRVGSGTEDEETTFTRAVSSGIAI